MSDFLTELPFRLIDPSRLPIALLALLLTIIAGCLFGPRRGNAMPAYWQLIGTPFGGLGSRLYRRQRSHGDLVFRGFIVTVFVIAASFVVGRFFEVSTIRYPFYRLPEIFVLSLVLTSGAVWLSIFRLFVSLTRRQAVKGAYYTIAQSTRIDLSAADHFTVTRNGMAMVARTFDKGLVAPVFWYLVGGIPAAFLYAGLAAMSWRCGKEGFSKGFGFIPAALEKVAGFIPSLIAGTLIALASLFTPTAGLIRALIGLFRSRGVAPYAEGGLPVTAMAYALKVSLNGPATDLEGSALQRAWVGPKGATAKLDGHHLRRAVYISIIAHLLFAACLGGLMVASDLI